jgi:DNA polymerase-4
VALNPALKGKPVIVGGRNGRGVVTSASYEARKYGVHSAMPGFQAKKLCPQGIFLPTRHGIYGEFSQEIFTILERYSPEVHAISIDEGVVDLTGTEKLFGPPDQTARKIIDQIRMELRLPASGGLSTNPVVAKIAATLSKPNGFLHVPAGSEEAFLSPLPVESIPGVGPKAQKELLQRGIRTVGELLKDPEQSRRFLHLNGGSREERSHDHSIGSETTMDAPVEERDEMEKVLWGLVEHVGRRLRTEGTYARSITLKIRYTNFATITRSCTLATPTRFDRQIFEVANGLLRENLSPGRAVRLLGVTASGLSSSGWQESLFGAQERRSWDELYQGIDRLRHKYGEKTIGVASPRIRTR